MTRVDPVLLQALIAQEAYDAGIVPCTFERLSHDMNRSLSDLSPEEARKIRRKFRKMWRNLVRKNTRANSNDLIRSSTIAHRMGLGTQKPNQYNSLYRKSLVLNELSQRARKKMAGKSE